MSSATLLFQPIGYEFTVAVLLQLEDVTWPLRPAF